MIKSTSKFNLKFKSVETNFTTNHDQMNVARRNVVNDFTNKIQVSLLQYLASR